MDEEEKGGRQLMTDDEEHGELQSERSRGIQLEIELEQSRAELRSLKDKQSYCCDRYSASQLS